MTLLNLPKLWTHADLLALPDDGIERYIINGDLREAGMTRRSFPHSRSMMKVGHELLKWLDANPHLGGRVVGGEAGVRLSVSPETTVGVDAAYVSREVAEATDSDAYLINGAPTVAVEILSPSDTHEAVKEKIGVYLKYGVRSVWILDPEFKLVTIHRPAQPPLALNVTGRIEQLPELPGFACDVGDLF